MRSESSLAARYGRASVLAAATLTAAVALTG